MKKAYKKPVICYKNFQNGIILSNSEEYVLKVEDKLEQVRKEMGDDSEGCRKYDASGNRG